MSYWEWDSSLNLGIDMVDAQHRHIVDFINELHTAQLSHDRFLVSKTLTCLLDYTVTHFAFEEKLIALANYPLTEAHQAIHVAFTARIHAYKQQHDNGVDIIVPLISELKTWLTQHIKDEDKNYVAHVKKRLNGGGGWAQH